MSPISLDDVLSFNGRVVGAGQPCFVIAEIGVNHNGDLALAKEHIDAAKAAGADCAKFQSFRTEEFMGSDVLYTYESNGRQVQESMIEMFKRLELPLEWHRELFAYCIERGLVPMTSVADTVIADQVEKMVSEGFKLASEDLINLDLVAHVTQLGRPIIFSTGMADSEEVDDVLRILNKHQHTAAAFLHCVSLYPTPRDEVNLRRMLTLKERIGRGVVGFSDHTFGADAAPAAVAMGAKIIEKHFTLDCKLDGPDHSMSADVDVFHEMVRRIREVESMLGQPALEPSITENKTARLDYRRSIVADQDLPEGHLITMNDLAYRRPGRGLRPRERDLLIGKRINRSIARNEMILAADVEPVCVH